MPRPAPTSPSRATAMWRLLAVAALAGVTGAAQGQDAGAGAGSRAGAGAGAGAPGPAAAASAPRVDAGAAAAPGTGPVIAAVWRSATACGSAPLARDALAPDPDAEAVRRARLVTLPRQHLQFQVPVVPGLPAMVLRLVADDRSRGVVDQYLLFSASDLAPPRAAVVVTDLPRGMDTRERAFDSVRQLERQLAANTGAYPSFAPVDGPYGDALEMIVPGRVPAGCFPTARFATAAREADGVPFGISRFAWVGGRLVEFALALSFPARMTLEDQHARAQAEMDAFWGGLSVY